ncbi:hypothetical protein Fot_40090 [Forsythia ovata]
MSSNGTKYGLYSPGSTGWSSLRNEEFQEEDVWGVFKERNEFDTKVNSFQEGAFTSKSQPTAAWMIPRANKNQNPSSHEPKVIQNSAPVNIPDWSKIYGTGSKINGHDFARSSREIDDDEEDDEGDITPPHEWIARKLARSQISSFSVCEGIGRTLKGRDLSSVRNAVLTKTGFLE